MGTVTPSVSLPVGRPCGPVSRPPIPRPFPRPPKPGTGGLGAEARRRDAADRHGVQEARGVTPLPPPPVATGVRADRCEGIDGRVTVRIYDGVYFAERKALLQNSSEICDASNLKTCPPGRQQLDYLPGC